MDGNAFDAAHAVIAEDAAANGRETIRGQTYLKDPKGALVPIEMVKPADLLMDESVRKMIGFAQALSAQIARFKQHTLGDIIGLMALLEQDYGAKVGGEKGNLTLTTFDGLMKVQLQVADNVTFGPELQVAKSLVDECLNEWAAESRAELRAIVQRAFNTDKEGLVNHAELYRLLRLDIADDRWQRAMAAIRDSMRVIGSKQYVRFYVREKATDGWTAVTIDLAAA